MTSHCDIVPLSKTTDLFPPQVVNCLSRMSGTNIIGAFERSLPASEAVLEGQTAVSLVRCIRTMTNTIAYIMTWYTFPGVTVKVIRTALPCG
mgnify:CR=1 FL=1